MPDAGAAQPVKVPSCEMHGACDVLATGGGAIHAQAGNLARFNRNFRKWKNLSFPEPIFPLITTDVLVRRCSRVCL